MAHSRVDRGIEAGQFDQNYSVRGGLRPCPSRDVGPGRAKNSSARPGLSKSLRFSDRRMQLDVAASETIAHELDSVYEDLEQVRVIALLATGLAAIDERAVDVDRDAVEIARAHEVEHVDVEALPAAGLARAVVAAIRADQLVDDAALDLDIGDDQVLAGLVLDDVEVTGGRRSDIAAEGGDLLPLRATECRVKATESGPQPIIRIPTIEKQEANQVCVIFSEYT